MSAKGLKKFLTSFFYIEECYINFVYVLHVRIMYLLSLTNIFLNLLLTKKLMPYVYMHVFKLVLIQKALKFLFLVVNYLNKVSWPAIKYRVNQIKNIYKTNFQ